MSETKTELAVPDETMRVYNQLPLDAPDPAESDKGHARRIARPVVVAELLALAAKVARTGTGLVAEEDRNGYHRAIGDLRELIADRLDELGVKVEEL